MSGWVIRGYRSVTITDIETLVRYAERVPDRGV
jgi:hypothetical protein